MSCTARRWVRVIRCHILGCSAARRDGDHAASPLHEQRRCGGHKCWCGSRWHFCSQPTIGTFPCIQMRGKEAKKRMCAGCSRSLWTMKEARTNQIAVCVNGAEVSIHNIALSNDWRYDFNRLFEGPTQPLLWKFLDAMLLFPWLMETVSWLFWRRTGFLFNALRRGNVSHWQKATRAWVPAGLSRESLWFHPLLTPASCWDTVAVPVGLVLLDERVASDEVAGYGSGFHRAIDSS